MPGQDMDWVMLFIGYKISPCRLWWAQDMEVKGKKKVKKGSIGKCKNGSISSDIPPDPPPKKKKKMNIREKKKKKNQREAAEFFRKLEKLLWRLF